MMNVSDDLVWLCVRKNSSFLVKRNGLEFTRERNNITGLNKFKYSGLANSKAAGIEVNEDGNAVLTKVTTKTSNPSKRTHEVLLKSGRGPKRNNQTIKSAVSKYYYRRDLLPDALAKHSKITKAAIRKAKGVKPRVKPPRRK